VTHKIYKKNKLEGQKNAAKKLESTSKDHSGNAGETSRRTSTLIKRQKSMSDNCDEDDSEHQKKARRCSEVRRQASATGKMCNIQAEQPKKKASEEANYSDSTDQLTNGKSKKQRT
jgi:hypothetical protein